MMNRIVQLTDEARSAFARSGVGDQAEWIIEGWFVAGRARWPDVAVAPDAFVRWIEEHVVGSRDAISDELRGDELYLTAACLARDPAALRAFDALLAAEVERVRPRRRDADAAAELQQVLRDKLLAGGEKLREFNGASSLGRWLRMVALRAHLDLVRAAGRRPTVLTDDGDLGDLAATDDSPELDYLKAHYRDAVRRAFAEAARELPADQRILVRQHHLVGVTLDQLAGVYGVHRVTIARRLSAARETLGARARERLAGALQVSPEELDQIFRLVLSQLDVSLHRLLS
ncbi:MAG TPA: sigma-70 family RNA polymerase sigma factor [Kofleriaceae bacterium]|jgi:RNA polymerase sigma-70 factor (ECF subfamily)|nr:sigma-70 family RNA polymerase sigma factor [Kofleriaceae bacterium]